MWSDGSTEVRGWAGAGSVPPLPFAPPHCAALFEDALRALGLCADAAAASASRTARTYVWGAAGALRHALAALANEGAVSPACDRSTFDTERRGGSVLVGGADGWDTVRGCLLPDGEVGTVRALWPVPDVADGIWLRADAALEGLAVRGRVSAGSGGSLRFVDEPAADRRPASPIRHDVGRDLVRDGPDDLWRSPALAAALELALVSGSWCHVASGRRCYVDRAAARAIMRMLGCPVTLAAEASTRLDGMVDREALAIVEVLGWRHLPTPGLV